MNFTLFAVTSYWDLSVINWFAVTNFCGQVSFIEIHKNIYIYKDWFMARNQDNKACYRKVSLYRNIYIYLHTNCLRDHQDILFEVVLNFPSILTKALLY